MKKSNASLYVSMTVFVMLLIACLTSLSIAGGTVKSEDRNVSGFHKVDLSGSFTVELTQGDKESLRLEAEEDVLTNITTAVTDGVLKIELKGKGWHNRNVKVYLTYKNLDVIASSGSIAMKGKGTVKFEKLTLDLSGAADLELHLEATTMKVDMSGSINATLSGTVTDMDVEISGSGKLDAPDLATQNLVLEIAGSGDAKVNVAKELNVDIAGVGSVSYKGNPNIKKSISGIGSVKKIG